jgi:hypothetical protein
MRIQLNNDKFWGGSSESDDIIGSGDSKADFNFNLLASKMTYNSSNKRMPKPRDINGFRHLPKYSDDELLFFVNTKTKELLVASRGSVTKTDWEKTDVALATGFLKLTPRYKGDLKQVNDVYNKYKGYTVLFTGHSLGGAIANYLYEDFKRRGINAELVIFNRGSGPIDPLIKRTGKRDPNKIHYTFKSDKYSKHFLKDLSTKHVVKESPHKTNKHSIGLHK